MRSRPDRPTLDQAKVLDFLVRNPGHRLVEPVSDSLTAGWLFWTNPSLFGRDGNPPCTRAIFRALLRNGWIVAKPTNVVGLTPRNNGHAGRNGGGHRSDYIISQRGVDGHRLMLAALERHWAGWRAGRRPSAASRRLVVARIEPEDAAVLDALAQRIAEHAERAAEETAAAIRAHPHLALRIVARALAVRPEAADAIVAAARRVDAFGLRWLIVLVLALADLLRAPEPARAEQPVLGETRASRRTIRRGSDGDGFADRGYAAAAIGTAVCMALFLPQLATAVTQPGDQAGAAAAPAIGLQPAAIFSGNARMSGSDGLAPQSNSVQPSLEISLAQDAPLGPPGVTVLAEATSQFAPAGDAPAEAWQLRASYQSDAIVAVEPVLSGGRATGTAPPPIVAAADEAFATADELALDDAIAWDAIALPDDFETAPRDPLLFITQAAQQLDWLATPDQGDPMAAVAEGVTEQSVLPRLALGDAGFEILNT